MNNLKKTVLAAAVATAMCVPVAVSADVITVTYDGWFTMIDPDGITALNSDDAADQGFYGFRSAITGTMAFDTATGAGSGTMDPFSFFGGGNASATSISFQAIGDGVGGPGSLVLGNMGFNWLGTSQNPASIVLDASGLFAAVAGGLGTSDIITGGALPATDDFLFQFRHSAYTLPIGAVPIATTTFNTTDIGTPVIGTNPSGTLPLTDDGIGGSPMRTTPFQGGGLGFNPNFDITTLHVVSIDTGTVPVPAAVWLFGSGLAGLVGVAVRRRRKI